MPAQQGSHCPKPPGDSGNKSFQIVRQLSCHQTLLLYKENSITSLPLATPQLSIPSHASSPSSQSALTQELSTSLVGTERLSLLPVLANQVEPGVTSRGVVELGWDVLLDFTPVCRG